MARAIMSAWCGFAAWWRAERQARMERHAEHSRALEEAGDFYGAARQARMAGDDARADALSMQGQ